MPTIRIDSFAGIMPRVHPTLLPDGCAVKAHNCRLKSGKLSPLMQPSQVTGKTIRFENGLDSIDAAKSIFLWRRNNGVEEFLAWPDIVKVAPSNIADDSLRRIFVSGKTGVGTGGCEPCVYISKSNGLGFEVHSLVKERLPSLTPGGSSPTLTLAEGSAADTDNLRYTFFFQTWVDKYGYESPVSTINPETDEVVYNDGDKITVAGIAGSPADAVIRRIYKVVTGTESESVQFVWEHEKSGVDFGDCTFTIKDEDAGEVLPHIESPPADLAWMTQMPGNFYVGFSASKPRSVMFSDVNRPSSWPEAYRYDVADDIMGVEVTGNTVVVMTKSAPWTATGTAPESMSVSATAFAQACVSSRSVCTMSGAVFYASHDGICMVSADSGFTVITEKFFSKREWADLSPETCIMAGYDGALHAWFTPTGRAMQGYIIDLRDGAAAVTTHDEKASAVFFDAESDGLYYVRGA